jgi:hypothetical protein
MANGPVKIRVQDFYLTVSDLIRFPAWEYALDKEGVEGQDERTVRPYLVAPSLDLQDTHFLVRASFSLADGTVHKGYLTPKEANRVDVGGFGSVIIPYDLGPTIVIGKDHIHFQYGPKKPTKRDLRRVYKLLAKKPEDVFPITFSSDVEVVHSIIEGKLDGFMYFDTISEFEFRQTSVT